MLHRIRKKLLVKTLRYEFPLTLGFIGIAFLGVISSDRTSQDGQSMLAAMATSQGDPAQIQMASLISLPLSGDDPLVPNKKQQPLPTDLPEDLDAKLPSLIAPARPPLRPNNHDLRTPGNTPVLVETLQPEQVSPELGASVIKVAQPAPSCVSSTTGEGSIVVSDQIQLRFFEESNKQAADGTVTTTSYERRDLSGIYKVRSNGKVSLPLLGHIRVLGSDLDCIEHRISQDAYDRLRAQLRVTASFSKRPEIVAHGDIAVPGRHQHIAGMTVQKLLSLAGAPVGFDQSNSAPADPYLTARKGELDAALLSNELVQSRISAVLTGADDLRLSPAQEAKVAALFGPNRIQAETASLQAERDVIIVKNKQLTNQLENLRAITAVKRDQLALTQEHLALLEDKHQKLLDMRARGLSPAQNLGDLDFKVMEAQQMLLAKKLDILELESRENEIIAQIDLMRAEHHRQLAVQLAQANEAQSGLIGQLQLVQAQLAPLATPSAPDSLKVTIERMGTDGMMVIAATETTQILPGDVVEISTKGTDVTRKLSQNIISEGTANQALDVDGIK